MPHVAWAWEIPDRAYDVPVPWWNDAPWCQPVSGARVDLYRTSGLERILTGDPIRDRVRLSGNTPLQAAGRSNTNVITWPVVGAHRVPLPEAVWLLRNSDDQWFGVGNGAYWEVSALRTGLLGWWAMSVVKWDLGKPWNQRNGLAGAGLPIHAMIPRPGELKAGAEAFERALQFVVAGGYSRETVPWVRKSDGGMVDHPLRAGERLRLTATAYDRLYPLCVTPDDRCIVWALRFYGAVVNDKTSATAGHAIRLPAGAETTVALKLTDFEVVQS